MRAHLRIARPDGDEHGDDDELALAGVEARAGVHVAEREIDDPVAEHAHSREELVASRLVAELRQAGQATLPATALLLRHRASLDLDFENA